ncbi:MAG: DJ-1/PfpI family protein [Candidatus Peregrinibacteria bacterium]|nr:DJ-1/PfpI family protein [Candidatus Peregrinibacteria bacterium]
MAKILSIIAPEGFQEVEYLDSKRALEENGHEVVTCSTHQIAFDRKDHSYKVDVLLDEIFEDDYDAVLFVGGPGVHAFFDDQDFQSVARAFHDAGKLTTAICAAPVILARAGLLAGKKATCFPVQVDTLKESGADYTGAPVEEDGLFITGSGPEAAFEFGLKIGENLK